MLADLICMSALSKDFDFTQKLFSNEFLFIRNSELKSKKNRGFYLIENQNDLQKINSLKQKFPLLGLKSNDLSLLKQGLQKKINFISFSLATKKLVFDSALANLANQADCLIVIDFNEILTATETDFLLIMKNAFLLKEISLQANCKVIVASFAKNLFEKRGSFELAFFLELIGFSNEQALFNQKNAFELLSKGDLK